MVRKIDIVARGQLQLHLRAERSFEMDMQLRFRETGDEFGHFGGHHGYPRPLITSTRIATGGSTGVRCPGSIRFLRVHANGATYLSALDEVSVRWRQIDKPNREDVVMDSLSDLDRSVTGEIYTSDESWQVLKELCTFGGRSAGTEGERQAVQYMLGKLEAYGLDNPHLEEFGFLGWKRGSSKLEITSPVQREISCLGQVYSASQVVEAPVVNCEWGHPDVFSELGDRVKGKIVLLRTRASHEAIPGKALQETDTERYARAVKAGAVGFINWNQVVGRSAMVRSMHYANIPGEIPATGLSHADGRTLMDLMEKGPVTVRMLERHGMEELNSFNVVAEIEGSSKADEIILFGAHHDGRDINQGALNDASGAVVVMEAARALARHKGAFARTIKLVIFSCEVYGYRGSFAYVDAHRTEMSRIRFMFNLDAAGRPGGSGLGLAAVGRPDLLPFLQGHRNRHEAAVPDGGVGSLRRVLRLRAVHAAGDSDLPGGVYRSRTDVGMAARDGHSRRHHLVARDGGGHDRQDHARIRASGRHEHGAGHPPRGQCRGDPGARPEYGGDRKAHRRRGLHRAPGRPLRPDTARAGGAGAFGRVERRHGWRRHQR